MIARAERLQQQFFQPALPSQSADWQPPMDILETDRALWIVVALPGVDPADLSISISDGVLSVIGIRRLPAAMNGAAVRRLEIPYGRFERRVHLPSGPLEAGRPELQNGCLFLRLAKRT